jgi:hypothetical protein
MKNITREEALELWLTTLEQHPERQTSGYLKKDDGTMCCLGQLCDLLYEESEIGKSEYCYYHYGEDENVEDLPLEVVRLMGFYDSYGRIPDLGSSLAEMNDDLGDSWPQIAKFIRENPDKVFKI